MMKDIRELSPQAALVHALAAFVLVGYLLQLATPLRLNGDAIVLLGLGASLADGKGATIDGEPTHFPSGLPVIIATMDRAGVANSQCFVALNLAFLGIGVAATYYLGREVLRLRFWAAYAACLFVLLSYVTIKHVTLPLSDVPYCGISLGSLGLLSLAETSEHKRRWGLITLGTVTAAAAISIRTVGIALIPAIIYTASVGFLRRRNVTLAIRKRPLLVTGISALAALAAVVCCYLVTRTMYFQEMLQVYVAGGILRHPLNRVINLGELVMNAPISKLPEISELMLVAAGISFLSLISSAIVLRRGAWSAIDVYCASYLAIIIAWPYNGARFLLPIGPIVFLYLMMIYTRLLRVRILKWILCFHLLVFSGLGIAALGFSTRISLARDTFPDVYGDGTLTPTYHEVFGTREVPRQDIHSDAAKLLLRYERRCGRVSRENHRQPAFDIPLERRYD